MFDFVFDFGAFWVPFWSHFGTPSRPFWETIFALFLDVAPRGPQEAPKRSPRDPKRLQGSPKRPQQRPKSPSSDAQPPGDQSSTVPPPPNDAGTGAPQNARAPFASARALHTRSPAGKRERLRASPDPSNPPLTVAPFQSRRPPPCHPPAGGVPSPAVGASPSRPNAAANSRPSSVAGSNTSVPPSPKSFALAPLAVERDARLSVLNPRGGEFGCDDAAKLACYTRVLTQRRARSAQNVRKRVSLFTLSRAPPSWECHLRNRFRSSPLARTCSAL